MSAKKPDDERVAKIPPVGIRMLPDLKRRIQDAADANNRSMNAEIVARLEASFDQRDEKPFTFEEVAALVDEIRQMRDKLKVER